MLIKRVLLGIAGGAAVVAGLAVSPATANAGPAQPAASGGLEVRWMQCGSTPNSGDCAIGRARDSHREIWIDAKRSLQTPDSEAATRQALSVSSAATNVYRYGAAGLTTLRVCVGDQPGVAAECSAWDDSFPMG